MCLQDKELPNPDILLYRTSHRMDGMQSNGDVDENLKLEAFKMCQVFLGNQWSKASINDFSFSTLSGGFSNQLFHCRLSEKIPSTDPRTPNQVLFRVYGVLQGDDSSIVVAEAATFMLLAERNLGPKLYGVFPKGRLEEYIPSRILNSYDIRKYSTTIAKEMAKIHSLQVPIRKIPDVITKYFYKWIEYIRNSTSPKKDLIVSLTKTYPEEMEWLCQQIESTESPIVFCHNDLQGGNILLRQDTAENEKPELMLIDFEFGTYNYRGFDIGNQFCEWCFDYNTKEYPHFKADFEKYPSKEEQIEFIEVYLKQMKDMGCLDENISITKETQKLLQEAMILRLASHLLWSTWSYKTSFIASLEFSTIEYGKTRFQGYLKHKKELMNAPFYKSFTANKNGHEL